jgi:ankyrin repeat protein
MYSFKYIWLYLNISLFLGKDNKGSTALMLASANGNESIVRALLAAGADINSELAVYLLLKSATAVVYIYRQLYYIHWFV